MNATQLICLLEALSNQDWQALAEGQPLHLVDDQQLAIGADAPGQPFFSQPPGAITDAGNLRRTLLSEAADRLASYYQDTPLTRAGFDRQVAALIEQHGAEAFAAVDGERPQRTLFVDGGEVVAEGPDSPRHPYGACCEATQSGDIDSQVSDWLRQGEAYEGYLGMNVCRYNC